MQPERTIARLLKKEKATLCTAESCSGGLLADRLTDIPGSSEYFRLGLITYSNDAKIRLLKVRPAIIKQHGAVSEQTAKAMAEGARRLMNTHFAIAITGIAGPGGGSKDKPIGLTFIAVAAAKRTRCLRFQFKGSRRQIKQQAATQAMKLLLKFLS